MPIFGEPREDPLVTQLKSEVLYLRDQLRQAQEQILAMTNAHAYRLLHPTEEPPPPKAVDLSQPYKPDVTMAQVMANFPPIEES